MDQNTGLEAMISIGGTRITLTMDSGETPSLLFRISLPDQTSHMGTTVEIMEDHLIEAQISHLIETTEIDLEMDLSTIRMRTGKTMAILHRSPLTQRGEFPQNNSYRQP